MSARRLASQGPRGTDRRRKKKSAFSTMRHPLRNECRRVPACRVKGRGSVPCKARLQAQLHRLARPPKLQSLLKTLIPIDGSWFGFGNIQRWCDDLFQPVQAE